MREGREDIGSAAVLEFGGQGQTDRLGSFGGTAGFAADHL
jgi:hypothetical protein